LSEPPLSGLPPLPEDPKDFAAWARNLTELAEQRLQAERQQSERAGEQRGRAEGERLGELRGEIRGVLRARGVEMSPELEQQLRACADPVVLEAWLKRAATASSAVEVLAG
jgi:hypothetical protein